MQGTNVEFIITPAQCRHYFHVHRESKNLLRLSWLRCSPYCGGLHTKLEEGHPGPLPSNVGTLVLRPKGLHTWPPACRSPQNRGSRPPPNAFNNASVYAVGLLLCGTLMDTGDEEG